jgi:hypothetical protein
MATAPGCGWNSGWAALSKVESVAGAVTMFRPAHLASNCQGSMLPLLLTTRYKNWIAWRALEGN